MKALYLLLLLALPVHAADLYSRTFYVAGVGNGNDQVPPLISQGQNAAPVNNVGAEPWEPFDISIVGVSVVCFDGTPSSMLAGNSFWPDIMLATGQTSATVFYPAGVGFPFPRRGSGRIPHIDLHVGARPSMSYQIFYTVYYVRKSD